jgi:hypothetical protein
MLGLSRDFVDHVIGRTSSKATVNLNNYTHCRVFV